MMFLSRAAVVAIAMFALVLGDGLAEDKRATDLIDNLERAMRDEAAAKPTAREDLARNSEATLSAIRANIRHGDQISSGSIQMILATTSSERVRKLCGELLAEIQKERDAREARFVPEANVAVNRTGELVLSAKVPKDLDGILKTLSDLKQRREDVTSEVGKRAFAKVEAALSVVTHWQNYLANLNAGNLKAARDALRPVADSNAYPVIPRSEILSRITEIEPPPAPKADSAAVNAILNKMQTLDDISSALAELNRLGLGSGNDHAGYELYTSLKKLEELYKDFRAGLPVMFNLHDRVTNQSHAQVSGLWAQFLLLAIPRYLEAPGHLPKSGESVTEYLARLRGEAQAENNLGLLLRLLEVYQSLDPSNSARIWGDMGAVRTCIAAKNQEDAGQYPLAVISYEVALRNAGDNTPVKFIGQRLETIKSEHRKEYDDGVQRYLRGEVVSVSATPPPTYNVPSLLTVPAMTGAPPVVTPSSTPFWSLQPGVTPTSPMPLNLSPTATPKPPLRRIPPPTSSE
jgi:hypothetical protein